MERSVIACVARGRPLWQPLALVPEDDALDRRDGYFEEFGDHVVRHALLPLANAEQAKVDRVFLSLFQSVKLVGMVTLSRIQRTKCNGYRP